MFILAMTAARAVEIPAVVFDELNGFANFHVQTLAEAQKSCATIVCLVPCRIIIRRKIVRVVSQHDLLDLAEF
jgi:hypothetical protein